MAAEDTSDLESAPSKSVATSDEATKPRPAKPPVEVMPPWKVLLHNDDVNDVEFVVETIQMLTPLNKEQAVQRTFEAHKSGISLLLTTHRERAELYQQQFTSRQLTVTVEPA